MISTVKRLPELAILLLAVQVSAQATQPRLVGQVDLRMLGVQIPAKGTVSGQKIEILFLRNSRLLLLDWRGYLTYRGGGSRLSVIEASSGAVLRTSYLTGGGMPDFRDWGQLQRISDVEFALAQSTGFMFCNAELECGRRQNVSGPVRFSQDGSRFIVGPRLPPGKDDKQWLLFDSESKQLASYSEDPQSQVLVGRTGTFFASSSGLRFYPAGQDSAIALRRDVSSVSIASVGVNTVAYMRRGSNQLAVVTSAGLEPFRVSRRTLPKVPWDAKLISSAQGDFLGVEYTANSRLQLLEPLACIDECPTPAIEQFVVLSSVDGRLIHSFKWDPRPWNLYVEPALSPDGKLAALVQGASLKIYALE